MKHCHDVLPKGEHRQCLCSYGSLKSNDLRLRGGVTDDVLRLGQGPQRKKSVGAYEGHIDTGGWLGRHGVAGEVRIRVDDHGEVLSQIAAVSLEGEITAMMKVTNQPMESAVASPCPFGDKAGQRA